MADCPPAPPPRRATVAKERAVRDAEEAKARSSERMRQLNNAIAEGVNHKICRERAEVTEMLVYIPGFQA